MRTTGCPAYAAIAERTPSPPLAPSLWTRFGAAALCLALATFVGAPFSPRLGLGHINEAWRVLIGSIRKPMEIKGGAHHVIDPVLLHHAMHVVRQRSACKNGHVLTSVRFGIQRH